MPGRRSTSARHTVVAQRARGHLVRISEDLSLLATFQALAGHLDRARASVREALPLADEAGKLTSVTSALAAIAMIETQAGRPSRAATIAGAPDALTESAQVAITQVAMLGLPPAADEARVRLDPETFERAYAAGRAMDRAAIIAFDQECLDDPGLGDVPDSWTRLDKPAQTKIAAENCGDSKSHTERTPGVPELKLADGRSRYADLPRQRSLGEASPEPQGPQLLGHPRRLMTKGTLGVAHCDAVDGHWWLAQVRSSRHHHQSRRRSTEAYYCPGRGVESKTVPARRQIPGFAWLEPDSARFEITVAASARVATPERVARRA